MNKSYPKNEIEEILKDIRSGKYRNCYLIYNRRSTDEPESQKNSIQYQRNENLPFLIAQKLPLASITVTSFCTAGIISEKHSGFKEGGEFVVSKEGIVQYQIDRPKFHQLVHYLSLGLFKGVICLCWDRISRNKGDNLVIDRLIKQGVDIQFSHASYDDTSSGMLHKDIDGIFSEHHSRVTSEKVRLAIKKNRAEGKYVSRAPIGYINEGNLDWKPFDPVRAPIIKRMFELYATGEWSLADMARYATEQGLTTVPSRRRRTKEEMLTDANDEETSSIPKIARLIPQANIQKIFTNPYYIGLIRGNDGLLIKSNSHEPLITKEIFNAVKAALFKKKTSVHYTDKLYLPHRGLFRCICGRIYTPYTKKGIQYYYSRCPRECSNTKKNIVVSFFESLAAECLKNYVFTDEEIEILQKMLKEEKTTIETTRKERGEEIERKKRKTNEDLQYLNNNKLSLLRVGAYTPEAYIAEEERLKMELEKLHQEETSKGDLTELIQDILKLSELLNNLYITYSNVNSYEKEKLIRIIFSELTLSENTLIPKCKKEFEPFKRRVISYCAPSTWISDLISNSKILKLNIKCLEEMLKPN